MKNKIVVIGSTNIDMVINLKSIPRSGETVGDGVFQIFNGGKGANQAVAAVRAGAEVSFVSCIGKDAFSNTLKSSFQQEGINTDYFFELENTKTGTALIMVDENAENCIGVAPGANGKLSKAHIEEAKSAIAVADYLLLQFEIPMKTIVYAIELAHQLGTKVLLNPAPAAALSDDLLTKIEVLILNETEAEFLMQKKYIAGKEAAVARHFLAKGVQEVVLTLGSKGAYIANQKEAAYIPIFPVEAIDTTGAGDTFCGALATALKANKPLKTAAIFASAAAAIAVTQIGAQSAIPKEAEINNFLNKN